MHIAIKVCVFLVSGLLHGSYGDYPCLCNYEVERAVLPVADNQATPLGYMYEFDCKELIESLSTDTYAAIAFEHQVGFIQMGSEQHTITCQGEPSGDDKILSTTTARHTTHQRSTHLKSTVIASVTSPAQTITTTTPTATPASTSETPTAAIITSTTTITTPTLTMTIPTETPPMPSTTSAALKTSITAPTTMITTPTNTATPVPNMISASEQTTEKTTTTPLTTSTSSPAVTSEASSQTSTATKLMITSPTTTASTQETSTYLPSGMTSLCPSVLLSATPYISGRYPYWAQLGQYCYELRPYSVDFSTATRDCISRHGSLLMVTGSDVERLVLDLLFQTKYQHPVWLGLTKSGTTWTWPIGTQLSDKNYSHWDSGYEDTLGRNCAVMDGTSGGWKPAFCQDFLTEPGSFPYICQYPIN